MVNNIRDFMSEQAGWEEIEYSRRSHRHFTIVILLHI